MKNKYLFLTHGIDSIGGGQLYIASKMEYLRSIGWDVMVFAFAEGKVMLPRLKSFQNNVIPELINHPFCYGKSLRSKILERLSEGCDENTIVESNSTMLSLWGELLAEKLKCKHLFYNINETSICQKHYLEYYRFKLYRNEFKGITNKSIPSFFSGLISINPNQEYCLNAIYDLKQVDDYNYTISDSFDYNSLTIGIVGRLDKPFILQVTKELVLYLKKKEGRFNIVYLGGAGAGSNIELSLRKELEQLKNVNVIFAGYLYPMPRNLIQCFDICISSSGAVRSITKEKILTISIDANDLKPIGIFGLTTSNSLYRGDEELVSLGLLLDDVLFLHKFVKDSIEYEEEQQDYSERWKPHLDFIKESCSIKDYYVSFPKPGLLKTILIRLFGISFYKKLWLMLKK